MEVVIKELDITECKESKDVFVEGYISAPVKDLDNEIISEDALKKIVRNVVNPPYNKVFLEHAPFKQNTSAVEKIPIGIIVESEFKNNKPWVKVKLNKAHPLFETICQSLKDGFIDAFSISFKPLKTKQQGSKTIITDLQILEVSLVGLPANPQATVERVYEKQLKDVKFEDLDEDEIEEKCKAGSTHHRTINRVAAKLVRLGKLRLRRKCLSCDDEDISLKDYTTKSESSDCKPPEETGGEMVGETCSGWVDERTGKELTWAEFKRRLAVALGIKPTQYIRNIFYAAYKRGLLSKEDMRKLGYNVKDDKEEKELTGLKSLNLLVKNMSEDIEAKMKELEVKNSDLQNQIKELEAKLKELEAEKAKLEDEKNELETKLKEMVEEKKAELIDEIKTIQPDANEEELKQKDVSELKDLALKAYRTKVLKLNNLPNKLPAGSEEGTNWDKIFGLKR